MVKSNKHDFHSHTEAIQFYITSHYARPGHNACQCRFRVTGPGIQNLYRLWIDEPSGDSYPFTINRSAFVDQAEHSAAIQYLRQNTYPNIQQSTPSNRPLTPPAPHAPNPPIVLDGSAHPAPDSYKCQWPHKACNKKASKAGRSPQERCIWSTTSTPMCLHHCRLNCLRLGRHCTQKSHKFDEATKVQLVKELPTQNNQHTTRPTPSGSQASSTPTTLYSSPAGTYTHSQPSNQSTPRVSKSADHIHPSPDNFMDQLPRVRQTEPSTPSKLRQAHQEARHK